MRDGRARKNCKVGFDASRRAREWSPFRRAVVASWPSRVAGYPRHRRHGSCLPRSRGAERTSTLNAVGFWRLARWHVRCPIGLRYYVGVNGAVAASECVRVQVIPVEIRSGSAKLADVELHFTEGPLTGLKLVGFGVWERRPGGLDVTFPGRPYSVNGERRNFALLRAADDSNRNHVLRDLILASYAKQQDDV